MSPGAGRSVPPATPQSRPARAYPFLLAIAATVVLLDQVSKALVTHALRPRSVHLLRDALRIHYTRNTGAAFSILPSGGLLFVSVAVLVSAGIVVYYRRVVNSPLPARLGLALILGGAVGNLIDRVRLGYVVDFIDLRWWPVFNLADSAVTVGAVLFFVVTLLPGRGGNAR